MKADAAEVPVAEILPRREDYRREMGCQILHDSFHRRPGWTRSFLLRWDGAVVGHGAVVVAGPWQGQSVIFEFHVAPAHRAHAAELFLCLAAASGATGVRAQTNDALPTAMLTAYGRDAACEKVIFADRRTTALASPGAALVRLDPPGEGTRGSLGLEPAPGWALAHRDEIVAAGGVLWHYNRPYGDLYYEVAAAHRRQGLGSYLVQELKRACREAGGIPCARCDPANTASVHTLLKAGFEPCGRLLEARLPPAGAGG